MKSRTCLRIIFVVFTSFVLSTEAYVFTVGGRDGWVVTPSDGYDPWAQRNRFLINDTLVFRYNNATDSVLVVNRQGYDSCSVSNPILRLTGGDSRFVFDRSGPFYFITGNQSNCQSGQKLVIVVLSPRTGTPPTTPTPTSPPIVAPANPPGTALTPSSPPVVAPASPPGTAPTPTPASPPIVAPANPPGTAPTPTPTYPPIVAPANPPGTAPTPTPTSPPIVAPASPPGTVPTPSTIPATTPSTSPPAPGADSPGGSGSLPGGSGAPGGSSSDTTPPRPSSSPVLLSSKVYTIGFSLLVTLALGSSLGFN